MSETEREKASAERRRVIDNNKAWKSAETVRRAWLKQFVTRKSVPKGAAVFVAVELAHASHELGQALEYNGSAMLRELLGVKDKAALVTATENATDARAQVLSLAFVLAAYEAKTGTHTWRQNDPDVARYFAYLAANGYELADVEKLCLPKASKPRRNLAGTATRPADETPTTASELEQGEVVA